MLHRIMIVKALTRPKERIVTAEQEQQKLRADGTVLVPYRTALSAVLYLSFHQKRTNTRRCREQAERAPIEKASEHWATNQRVLE